MLLTWKGGNFLNRKSFYVFKKMTWCSINEKYAHCALTTGSNIYAFIVSAICLHQASEAGTRLTLTSTLSCIDHIYDLYDRTQMFEIHKCWLSNVFEVMWAKSTLFHICFYKWIDVISFNCIFATRLFSTAMFLSVDVAYTKVCTFSTHFFNVRRNLLY